MGGRARSQQTPSRSVVARKRTTLDWADSPTCGGRERYSKRRAQAHMRVQEYMQRGADSARKTITRVNPLGRNPVPISGPDSGPDFGTGFRPPILIYILGPESGPESGGGIRSPNRYHLRGHVGPIWGRRWRNCRSFSWPEGSRFLDQCKYDSGLICHGGWYLEVVFFNDRKLFCKEESSHSDYQPIEISAHVLLHFSAASASSCTRLSLPFPCN